MNCIHCNQPIIKQRLEALPNTKTCVTCSQEKPKAGRTITIGSGENFYTDVEVLDRDVYERVIAVEKKTSEKSFKRASRLNLDYE